jgi:hypothetical protein
MDGVRVADWRLYALLAVIALQVAVPLIGLLDPPTRFSFQMYSGRGQVDVVILDRNGDHLPFDAGTTIAGFRPELDWTGRLPAYLCREVPGARTVTVRQNDDEVTETCR